MTKESYTYVLSFSLCIFQALGVLWAFPTVKRLFCEKMQIIHHNSITTLTFCIFLFYRLQTGNTENKRIFSKWA